MNKYGKTAVVATLMLLAGCQSAGHKGAANTPVDPEMDRCGASELQHYVGKPMTVLQTVRFDKPMRAIPYNSSVTMDFNLNRINFLGDQNGNVTRVYCG